MSLNEPPYFHHGRFSILREAVLAHAGAALNSRIAFQELLPHEQDASIEFLKWMRTATRHRTLRGGKSDDDSNSND
jgi:cytochrome c peroxidase